MAKFPLAYGPGAEKRRRRGCQYPPLEYTIDQYLEWAGVES